MSPLQTPQFTVGEHDKARPRGRDRLAPPGGSEAEGRGAGGGGGGGGRGEGRAEVPPGVVALSRSRS